MHAITRAVSKFPPAGLALDKAIRVIWTSCGGPLEEVAALLETLAGCDLVTLRDGRVRITKSGRLVATQDHQQGGRLLGLSLIRSGHFAEQARLLTEAGSLDSDGSLRCPRGQALKLAPQLVGILRRWPATIVASDVLVPADIAKELGDVWVFEPSRSREESLRLKVGDRAELYTYQLERLRRGDASSIRWVSRENQNLGYDVEDVSESPSRLIEVKGSGGAPVRFFLSVNEWRVAHLEARRFEIHYWGEIDLNLTPQKDFDRLRGRGFPLVFRNLERLVGLGHLAVEIESFDVTAPDQTTSTT